MIRFNVIRFKPVVKRITIIILIILCIFLFSMLYVYINKNIETSLEKNVLENTFFIVNDIDILTYAVDNTSSLIKITNSDGKVYLFNNRIVEKIQSFLFSCNFKDYKSIISNQLPLIGLFDITNVSALSKISEQKMQEINAKEKSIDEAKIKEEYNEYEKQKIKSIDEILKQEEKEVNESLSEENVEEITIKPNYDDRNYLYDMGVYIKNNTNKEIDILGLLKEKIDMNIPEKEPAVLIVHTHTSESYTPTQKFNYIQSDPDRTENNNFNVVRVGKELKLYLQSEGIEVVHDYTCHDYPSYDGSYRRSLKTIAKNIKKYPSICIVIDIHRDAFALPNGNKLKVSTNIDNQKVAQVMQVIGTDGLGLNHPKWKENLKFAIRLQQQINILYPELARPINLRKERFNQHVTTGSILMEIGSNGNTLEEALLTCKYLSKAIAQTIRLIDENKI